MKKGFIKNTNLIQETHEISDLLNLNEVKDSFRGYLNSISTPSLVGLIAPFGTGKSTMLYQLSEESKDEELWFEFDAWKYPNRDNLWEGFVLDFCRKISPDKFQHIKDTIDKGEDYTKEDIINIVSSILPLSMLKGLSSVYNTSPAKRVFELQDILTKYILEEVKKDIYIIVEDIDRSGDRGMYFLETLNYFIKNFHKGNPDFGYKIICVVPLDEKIFYENHNSYIKSISLYKIFRIEDIDFSDFINNIFDEDLFQEEMLWREHLDDILKHILNQSKQVGVIDKVINIKLTMRDVKIILRKANASYCSLSKEDKVAVDIRIMILFEMVKYCSREVKEIKDEINLGLGINNFIVAIAENRSVEDVNSNIPIKKVSFVNNRKNILPKFWHPIGDDQGLYALSDIYKEIYQKK